MFKKIRQTSVIVTLFIFSYSFGQDKTIDSLKAVFQNPQIHDTTKLSAIAMGISAYNQSEPGFIYLNKQMGALASKNYLEKQSREMQKKYAMYLAAYYNNMGNDYGSKRDVAKAIASYDKGIALSKFAEAYDEMNFTLISKGTFLSKINEYDQAISCMFTALKYFEKHPKENQDEIMYIMSSLASIYGDQGKHGESIMYNKNVIDHFSRQTKLTNDESNSKAMAHVNCGTSWLEIGNYQQAMTNFVPALALFKKTQHPIFGSITLTKMARVKMKEAKFDEAEALFTDALKSNSNDIVIASVHVKLGELFYLKKDFDKADYYLTEGLSRSKKLSNLELQEQSSELLFKVSTARRNFEKALDM
ncbi:MAG TPA: tetratricopeptide repeat protein, partial [Flavobacterium sp.]|nr:tetratricopeptide repeat protein [Flavobacterium sp.]